MNDDGSTFHPLLQADYRTVLSGLLECHIDRDRRVGHREAHTLNRNRNRSIVFQYGY